jgi:hypothetical protein
VIIFVTLKQAREIKPLFSKITRTKIKENKEEGVGVMEKKIAQMTKEESIKSSASACTEQSEYSGAVSV